MKKPANTNEQGLQKTKKDIPTAKGSVDGRVAVVGKYLADVNAKFKTGTAREHSYRPALVNLLKELIPNSNVINDGAQIACGAPDCTIIDKNSTLVVGYVEAKDVGEGDIEGE